MDHTSSRVMISLSPLAAAQYLESCCKTCTSNPSFENHAWLLPCMCCSRLGIDIRDLNSRYIRHLQQPLFNQPYKVLHNSVAQTYPHPPTAVLPQWRGRHPGTVPWHVGAFLQYARGLEDSEYWHSSAVHFARRGAQGARERRGLLCPGRL